MPYNSLLRRWFELRIGFHSEHCGCVLRETFCLPCAYELACYDPRVIPLPEIYIMWTRLTFSNISSS